MTVEAIRTPKRKTNQPKSKTFIIEEVYPGGMSREQYIAELRKRARYFARLFLQIYPNVLIQDEDQNEKVVTSPRF